ncbi:hypothetical protein FHS18_005672 [Paenibacillus phyllosphaerae]|uniref:Uncharacterized protein n=1 Tax=Paenibacillus phyllosphaerae TaxID=274593 RepID=A0A7W5FQK3_9BACL|nr:hypothetical protein [Paenibacillus phyllosphaerae]MBB3113560.1 hypothetical protein [Paenibacillus phyllosphaerae]
MSQEKDHKLEQELAEQLEHGPMKDGTDQAELTKDKLSPKYEVRIQADYDPIVEETAKFREMAKEVDDRYDGYMNRAEAARKPKQD